MKKSYIKIEDKQYVAEMVGSDVYSNNGDHKGLLFRIQNNQGEIIGCLSAFISVTTKAIWNSQGIVTQETIENLFLRILPYIPFAASVAEFKSVYPRCIQLFIDSSDTVYIVKDKVQYVRGEENPLELVKHLVFDGNIDDDQVQRDILSFLYENHLEDRTKVEDTVHIAKSLFIDEDTVFRCLDYLEDDGYVNGTRPSGTPGIFHPTITTAGVRYVKNNFQQIRAGREVVVMGDYVGKDKIITNIQGDNNQNIVKSTISNSFNMNLVYQKVDALKEAIDKEYVGIDKQVLIGEIDEVKTLAAEKKNYSKIREILGSVLARTSEFAQIATLGIELFKLFTGVN